MDVFTSTPIMTRISILIFIVSQLSACAVYPAIDNEAENTCDVFTRQLTLDITDVDVNVCGNINNGSSILVCLGVSGAFFVTSAVVSGSVVVVGNTVNFLEQQGRCDDSYLRRKVEEHAELFN